MDNTESSRPNRAQALEGLSQYQRSGSFAISPDEMGRMVSQESDRGIVVILSSILEDALLFQLERKFVSLTNTERKNLTRNGGLLANFDDRINLAHALGMIDADGVETLRIFKSMRNACAHSRREITFLTPQLREVMAYLFEGEGVDDVRDGLTNPHLLRFAFMSAFTYQMERIMGATEEDAQRQAQQIIDIAYGSIEEAVQKRLALREKRKTQQAKRPRKNPKG